MNMKVVRTHTPGPWRVNPITLDTTPDNAPGDAAFEIVAHVHGFSEPRVLAMTALVEGDDPTGWLATDEANCRLMAAAPRLLAALRGMVDAYDNKMCELYPMDRALTEARAAIAAAIGDGE